MEQTAWGQLNNRDIVFGCIAGQQAVQLRVFASAEFHRAGTFRLEYGRSEDGK
jgi:hypothetical protein